MPSWKKEKGKKKKVGGGTCLPTLLLNLWVKNPCKSNAMKKCDENEINVLLYIWGFGRIPLSFEHIKWKDPQHPEGCE